ncbi:MAG: AIR synthase-related protein, partial [Desulfobulbales bacterium]
FAENIPQGPQDILFDPQTSGGLVIAVAAAEADELLRKLVESGITDAALVGEVMTGAREMIFVE